MVTGQVKLHRIHAVFILNASHSLTFLQQCETARDIFQRKKGMQTWAFSADVNVVCNPATHRGALETLMNQREHTAELEMTEVPFLWLRYCVTYNFKSYHDELMVARLPVHRSLQSS